MSILITILAALYLAGSIFAFCLIIAASVLMKKSYEHDLHTWADEAAPERSNIIQFTEAAESKPNPQRMEVSEPRNEHAQCAAASVI
jgi:hypothetical protein